jgi:hypothetical protein
MSILIGTLLERVKDEFSKPEIEWETIGLNEKDMIFLRKECNTDSEFDPTNKRKKMFNGMINNELITVMYKCEYGQIIAIFETIDQIAELPWDLWGRILRMFSESDRKPFKVYFLANKSLRLFPSGNDPITPENINGGYTYRCNPETIIIYRAEDATRVLIHELQHSCCLDRQENGLDIIEAETEAWAELFYIAILSQGKKYIFNDLLQRQSEWMIEQNKKIKMHMKNPNTPIFLDNFKKNIMEFPWRYTIGKEQIWDNWGILRKDKMKPVIKVNNSLRLTYPPNNILKERFKVIYSSTIL